MKKIIIDDDIINNTCVDEQKLTEYYIRSGYDPEDDLTWTNIFNARITIRRKIWYFANFAELTEEQLFEIANALKAIVLPILQAKYPDVELTNEIIEQIRIDGNEDAYYAARAQLNELSEHIIMSVAYCIVNTNNEDYKTDVINYLIDFVDNN